LQLAAPVEALRLAAEQVEALPGASGGLFDDGLAKESMAALIERLRARLGEERIFGLGVVADHRPECATQRPFPGVPMGVVGHARPFWLLALPEPMSEIADRPYRHGPLQLLAGPERIESGWWQEGETGAAGVGDCRRDYFIARTADARWAWIFRELRAPGGWFLHGWFA
jgi:protein ImuB